MPISLKTMRRIIEKTVCCMAMVLLTGCVGIGTQSPKFSEIFPEQAVTAAQEIANSPPPIARQISVEQATTEVAAVWKRLLPVATEICRYLGENENCSWDYFIDHQTESYNAWAAIHPKTGEQIIGINIGVLLYTQNEHELAALVAHEIGHHVANHLAEKEQNITIGKLIAGLGAVAALWDGLGYMDPDVVSDTVEDAVALGASVAEHAYSRDQELEANYLAAYMLHRSGFDLSLARREPITLAKASSDSEGFPLLSEWGQTHPSFPEQLVAWDATIREIDNGVFPPHDGYSRSVGSESSESISASSASCDVGKVWCAKKDEYSSECSKMACQLKSGIAFSYDKAGLRMARVAHFRIKYHPLLVVGETSK